MLFFAAAEALGDTDEDRGERLSYTLASVRLAAATTDSNAATARDLAESVHPHPTLSETLMECAEAFYGHSTHVFSRRPAKQEQA